MMKHQEQEKQPNILFRLLALILTAALLLGAVFLVANRDRFNLDALKRWLSYRSLETSASGEAKAFTHAGGDQVSFAYLDSGLVLSSSIGARYYSFSGDLYAEEVLALEHPVLTHSEKAGVVYDAGGQELFVFSQGQETFHLSLEDGGDLLSARLNSSGWLAVTAQESGYKGSVTVYDNTYQKQIIKINLSSTFVVDAAVSPDCKTVAVVTMGQENGSFQSQVRFYLTNAREPYAVVSLGNVSVLDLDYESDRLWVLGEDRLMVLDPGQGTVTGEYTLGRNYLKGCSLGGDGFAVLLLGRYRAGSASQLVTVGSDGAQLATMDISSPILDFDAAGRYISALSGDALTIFTSDLIPYSTLDETQNARYTAMSPEGAAMLANTQQAWLYLPS